MALFDFGKDKRDGGSLDQVMAYLEDAARVRSAFTLLDPRKHEIPASLLSLDEPSRVLTLGLSGPLVADKGAKVTFVMIHDGLRIGAQTRVLAVRQGAVDLDLPERLELMERRKAPRARVNPREGATATALTGLFEGVGITGIIENLSEGGFRMRVEKAMGIQGEKKLMVTAGLVKPGTPMIVVKLNKLPKCPASMEISGILQYEDASAGLCVGITFTNPPNDVLYAVRGFVGARASAIPATLPPKTRRTKEPEDIPEPPRRTEPDPPAAEAPKPVEPPPVAPPPVAPPPVAPPPVAPDLPQEQAAPAPAAPEPARVPLVQRGTPLKRLKRKGRTLVVAARDPVVREMLQVFLLEEGYGRVLVAGTLSDLLELVQQPGVGLVVVDGGVAELGGMELAFFLGQVREEPPPLVLAADEVSSIMVLEARRAGVAQLLVKPYTLDDALAETLDGHLGLA